MREIKFRALSNLGKEWVYSNGYYFDGLNYWFTISGQGNMAIAWTRHIRVLPETIAQFTGLKDKNGVEIYEGNILQVIADDDEKYNNPVIWNEDVAAFHIVEVDGCQTSLREVVDRWEPEVISNIHESRELLE